MTRRHVLNAQPPNLPHVNLRPAVASLPTILPTERRNIVERKALLRRIRGEFEEMPGLSLTLLQASKLFGIYPEACSRILLRLIDEGLLGRTASGNYALRPRS